MAKLYAGLDVSQNKTAIAVVNAAGAALFETEVMSEPGPIGRALRPYRPLLAKVGHEAGSFSPYLHARLLKQRLPMFCLDARQIRAALSAQRNKTDRTDARDIAIALARGFDRFVYVKSDESHRIRLLLIYRRVLKRRARDLEMTLRFSVKVFGIRITRQVGGVLAYQYPKGRRDREVDRLNASLLEVRQTLLDQVKHYDAEVKRLAKACPVCVRLMTAPGVGPLTALTFKAAIDDPKRFKSSRLVGAHFGLTPRRWQSGEIDHRGGISHLGDKEVRATLYEAASVILGRVRKPSALRDWATALAARKGFRFAATACARKLAVILHRMWVTETAFDPAHKRL